MLMLAMYGSRLISAALLGAETRLYFAENAASKKMAAVGVWKIGQWQRRRGAAARIGGGSLSWRGASLRAAAFKTSQTRLWRGVNKRRRVLANMASRG